jgi:hypothetical protein
MIIGLVYKNTMVGSVNSSTLNARHRLKHNQAIKDKRKEKMSSKPVRYTSSHNNSNSGRKSIKNRRYSSSSDSDDNKGGTFIDKIKKFFSWKSKKTETNDSTQQSTD